MSHAGEGELVPIDSRPLTQSEFQRLAHVPPELEWLAVITNSKSRRAYEVDFAEFLAVSGLAEIKSLRAVARSDVIGWRMDINALAPLPSRRFPRFSIISVSATRSSTIGLIT